MPEFLEQLHQDLHEWSDGAIAKGWLTDRATELLDSTTVATPGALFEQASRPLVVGLFGGTGVGKSTLLNRFAGEDIARASAERPTSREITVYLHESISVSRLPDEFPMQQMRKQIHQNERYQSVMWIDMPDFDSVEQSNRDLVNHWLPHIDVVIYVVSPERYKDDNGWRLLLEHGSRHAWVFVINHWDRGDERQRDDFNNLLATAGLANPMIFCTDSSNASNQSATNSTDEFSSLQETLVSLAEQQLITQLESRGVVQRVKQIRATTQTLRTNFGNEQSFENLHKEWDARSQTLADSAIDSVRWKIPNVAEAYAEPEQGLLRSIYARIRGQQTVATDVTLSTQTELKDILDDTYFDRINESVDGFAQHSVQEGMNISALRNLFSPLKSQWQAKAHPIVENAIQQSIAAPSSAFHRQSHRILGWLCWILPLAALTWVGYRIVNAFRLGANDPAAYLSSNFAVNGALLLALAWFVPTVLFIKLKPSRSTAAARGIENGLTLLGNDIKTDVSNALSNLDQDKQHRLNALDNLLTTNVNYDANELPESLKRMLVEDMR